MDCRPKFPLALENNKIMEKEGMENVVVDLNKYTPSQVGVHQIRWFLP